MKKLITAVPLLAVALAFGLTLALNRPAAADPAAHNTDIVGVWEVNAVAPYAQHLFTFNSDGTMLSTNPTNVQENPAKPNGGTNDSVGMGVWKIAHGANGEKHIEGTFEELNALADTHLPTDTLSVSFKLELSNDGSRFDGPAKATVGSETDDSHLTGTRLTVNKSVVDTLSDNDYHL